MNEIINRIDQIDQKSKADILDQIAKAYIEAMHFDFESNRRGFHSIAEKFGWEAYKILIDKAVLAICKQERLI